MKTVRAICKEGKNHAAVTVYLFRWMWISLIPLNVIFLLKFITVPGSALLWRGEIIIPAAMLLVFLLLDCTWEKKYFRDHSSWKDGTGSNKDE